MRLSLRWAILLSKQKQKYILFLLLQEIHLGPATAEVFFVGAKLLSTPFVDLTAAKDWFARFYLGLLNKDPPLLLFLSSLFYFTFVHGYCS